MDMATIDQIRLNFNPQGLFIINMAIGLMMFGVALDLNFADFKRVIVAPKAPGIGLLAQFILLPAFTFLLILMIKPHPSMALGMILVAACPGGNLSNIMTYLAKGNCAVSISMTAISTVAAIFMTPLNLSLWGSLNPATADILRSNSVAEARRELGKSSNLLKRRLEEEIEQRRRVEDAPPPARRAPPLVPHAQADPPPRRAPVARAPGRLRRAIPDSHRNPSQVHKKHHPRHCSGRPSGLGGTAG